MTYCCTCLLATLWVQGVTAMYSDFFGPAPPGTSGGADDEQQTDDQDNDSIDDDQADDDQAPLPGSEDLDDEDLDLMNDGEDVGEGEEDLEDGEDDEIFAQIRERGGLLESEDQDQDGDDDDDMDDDGDLNGKQRQRRGDGETDADVKPLSNHQKRLLRIQVGIIKLEIVLAMLASSWTVMTTTV